MTNRFLDLDLNLKDLYLNHKCLKFKSLRFKYKSRNRLVTNHSHSGFILNPCNLECRIEGMTDVYARGGAEGIKSDHARNPMNEPRSYIPVGIQNTSVIINTNKNMKVLPT